MCTVTLIAIPKVTFCWQTETCLPGALSSSNRQEARLKERIPARARIPEVQRPLCSLHDTLLAQATLKRSTKGAAAWAAFMFKF